MKGVIITVGQRNYFYNLKIKMKEILSWLQFPSVNLREVRNFINLFICYGTSNKHIQTQSFTLFFIDTRV